MSYRASIHDLSTGRFLLHCNVEAMDPHEAESTAIAKAARAMKTHPREVDVRHLHQCMSRARENVTDSRQIFE